MFKFRVILCTAVVTLFIHRSYGQLRVSSPNQKITAEFSIDEEGAIFYSLYFKKNLVIDKSRLGLIFKEADFSNGFSKITDFNFKYIKDKWKPVWGEVAEITDEYNQLIIHLEKPDSPLKLTIQVRMYNDAFAFRYEIRTQFNLRHLTLVHENTQFNLTDNHTAFWIPADFDSQEYVYKKSPISEIDADAYDLDNGIAFKSIIHKKAAQSPLLMKTNDGIYINIFEAAVDNYPVMHLKRNEHLYGFDALLPPNPVGYLAHLQAPFNSPWRVVFAVDDPKLLLASKTILNLNEPSKIFDTSWIKPMKYVGVWWEMHIGKSTWDYAGSQSGANTQIADLKPTGKHGANTQNVKRYIDFASKHGFDAVLVEGWNVGWEDWFGNWKEDVFDFVTPYPDFDIEEITAYAKQKDVKLIMHHETSGSVTNYERHLDRALKFMVEHGYPAVKTGYVGRIIPRGEYHDGQWMVNHYHRVVREAAKRKIMVNSHESSRPTGMHRTYPNYLSAEAARGNEFNAWSKGNPPSHETILPFTRLMGGPMDYTPGIFSIYTSTNKSKTKQTVKTTLAKQLALYVTMYSPLQMAADLPEHYEAKLDAFQFIKDVPVDWSDTVILESEPGEFITIVRKDKNSSNWFLGAITNENNRSTQISLSFLEKGKKYKATIYEDAPTAHWQFNPEAYQIRDIIVDNKTILPLRLAQGGGVAIKFSKIDM